MQELLLKTITKILAESSGLEYTKDKIWNPSDIIKYSINGKTIVAYCGIRLALVFDKKNSYITITPSYMFTNDLQLSEEEKKHFADFFYSNINKSQPNKFVNQYICLLYTSTAPVTIAFTGVCLKSIYRLSTLTPSLPVRI